MVAAVGVHRNCRQYGDNQDLRTMAFGSPALLTRSLVADLESRLTHCLFSFHSMLHSVRINRMFSSVEFTKR
jgi:hypothetical protein